MRDGSDITLVTRFAGGDSTVDMTLVPDLSLAELVGFLRVVHERSFTRAARAMHLSQPGLSARVARLEKTLGFALIDRGSRGASLTPEGRVFVDYAMRTVALIQHGTREARRATRSPRLTTPTS